MFIKASFIVFFLCFLVNTIYNRDVTTTTAFTAIDVNLVVRVAKIASTPPPSTPTTYTFFRTSPISSSTSAPSITTRIYAGPATLEPPVKENEVIEKVDQEERVESKADHKRGAWAVRLFNDPMNKREFVALCLSKIVGLSDGQAYQVMMQAHQNGIGIVGRFDLERAELYKTALNDNGLTCDMVPVDDE